MREAKRRATQFSIPPTNREIEQAWKAMRTEGDGVYMLTVLSPVQVFEMLSRAQRGDRVALTILETIEHVLESVGRNPPDTPLCLLCGAEFDQLPEHTGMTRRMLLRVRSAPSAARSTRPLRRCGARLRTTCGRTSSRTCAYCRN